MATANLTTGRGHDGMTISGTVKKRGDESARYLMVPDEVNLKLLWKMHDVNQVSV
jgi:hypothetical protein